MKVLYGQSKTLRITFLDKDGQPATVASAALALRKPDNSVATPSLTGAGTGAYTSRVLFDQEGTWFWRATGVRDGAQLASEGTVLVAPSSFM